MTDTNSCPRCNSCAFCGGEYEWFHYRDGTGRKYLGCGNRDCVVHMSTAYLPTVDVEAAWNTRADTAVAKAVAAERERCLAIVEAFKQANAAILEGSEIGAHRSHAIQRVLSAVSHAIRGDSK